MIDQALYTHSRRLGGWGIVTCSVEHVDADLSDAIRSRSDYTFPTAGRVAGPTPTSPDEQAELPSALRVAPDGLIASVSTLTPSGREMSGDGSRGGNIVAHTLFSTSVSDLAAAAPVRPIQLLKSPSVLVSEPPELELERLEAVEPGLLVSEDSAAAFLTEVGGEAIARAVVGAVLKALWAPGPGCTAVCIVCEEPAALVGWLSVVQFWLPRELCWRLPMLTFTSRPLTEPADRRGAAADGELSVLYGATAQYVERGMMSHDLCCFEMEAATHPQVESGPLAQLLLAHSYAEARAFIDTIDVLVARSAVPEDEAGWLIVCAAAALLLGDLPPLDSLPALGQWMRAHGSTLGRPRVEALAFALPRDLLGGDEILAIVGAGSDVGSTEVVETFEREAFDRSLAQAVDLSLPPPSVPPVSWSIDLQRHAVEQIVNQLDRCTVDSALRMIDLAAAMELDLPKELLENLGRRTRMVLEALGGDSPVLPSAYRQSLAIGLLHALGDPDAAPLQRPSELLSGLDCSGLGEVLCGGAGIQRELDATRNPFAYVLCSRRTIVFPEDRIEVARNAIQLIQDDEGAAIDNVLRLVWSGTPADVAAVRGILGMLPRGTRSHWVGEQVDVAVENAHTLSEIEELEDLIQEEELDDLLLATTRRRLYPINFTNRVFQATFRNEIVQRILEAWPHVEQAEIGISVDLTKRLGQYSYMLDGFNLTRIVRQLEERLKRNPDDPLFVAFFDGLVMGLREMNIDYAGAAADAAASMAVAFLPRWPKVLETLCREMPVHWDDQMVGRVTFLLGQRRLKAQSEQWQAFAKKRMTGLRSKLR